MQTLGEALARVRPQRADHPEDLERLVTLEPTVILERRLAIARQQLGAELARLDPELELDQAARPPQAIRRADDRVARALADVKLGRRRDLLALAFGCWCLGIGGRELRPAWREGLGFLDVDGAPVEVCAKYCDCPVGARLEAEHAAALDLALRQAEAARHGRIWRSVPRELRDVTLDSYPGEDPSQVRALGLVRRSGVGCDGERPLAVGSPAPRRRAFRDRAGSRRADRGRRRVRLLLELEPQRDCGR